MSCLLISISDCHIFLTIPQRCEEALLPRKGVGVVVGGGVVVVVVVVAVGVVVIVVVGRLGDLLASMYPPLRLTTRGLFC